MRSDAIVGNLPKVNDSLPSPAGRRLLMAQILILLEMGCLCSADLLQDEGNTFIANILVRKSSTAKGSASAKVTTRQPSLVCFPHDVGERNDNTKTISKDHEIFLFSYFIYRTRYWQRSEPNATYRNDVGRSQ
jgi:hypothetical protein